VPAVRAHLYFNTDPEEANSVIGPISGGIAAGIVMLLAMIIVFIIIKR
jgi:hypothetical protein